MFYWTKNLPSDIHRPSQLDRWYFSDIDQLSEWSSKTNNLKTIIWSFLLLFCLNLQKISETDQDSSSKAPNMQIQTLMPVPLPNPKPEKPEKFDGTEFKMWQQKMLFYLTTLHLTKFLQEDPPEPGTDRDSVLAVDAWMQGDFLCWNYILDGLDDSLYNVYSPITTTKKLWASLDKKYKLRMPVSRSSS